MSIKTDLTLNRVINMLMAHPDNEPSSEFSDKIDSLISLREELSDKEIISLDDYNRLLNEETKYNTLYEAVLKECDEQDENNQHDASEIGLIVCEHFGIG